jgi:polysaccharide biosynthesis/export protein
LVDARGALYLPRRMGGTLLKKALVALSLTLGSCGPSVYETYAYGKEWDPRRHEYIIGISDAVRVSVYHAAELSTDATVRPDGVITMPLLGDLTVAGKTPTAVRDEVKLRLTEFVKTDPAVTVTVSAFNSYRFVVGGNVNHPGALGQKWFVTISEAIAMAGGPNKFAGDHITVLRLDTEGKIRRIPVSYKALVSGKHPEEDICVVSGDAILVD